MLFTNTAHHGLVRCPPARVPRNADSFPSPGVLALGLTGLSSALLSSALLSSALLTPSPAVAFAGMPFGTQCTDFINAPQDFHRLRQGPVTYRISNNFKDRYPDSFSQYLVRDVAELWELYIGGVTPWNAEIADRFSFYRRDPDEVVYELKSVLSHEFGHAVGMQHSDACFYNTSNVTNLPLNMNYRTSGGVLSVQPTLGEEMMNERPTDLVLFGKYEGPVDGYFRTPGLDALQFVSTAYPFQSIDFQEIDSGTPDILFDSTDVAGAGGQATILQNTDVVPGQGTLGQFIDSVNIWVGNDIGKKSFYQSWSIENFTGVEIRQIGMRIDGTSTRRAIFETAPPEFTSFGASFDSSPERLIVGWSAPFDGAWPAGGTGWLGLNLDVHDWALVESFMLRNSNEVFSLFLSHFESHAPWPFASPNSPPPQLATRYSVEPILPPEPTAEPDDIELVPPATDVDDGITRGFTVFVPAEAGGRIERFELLPLDWPDAEILVRQPESHRMKVLTRLFETEHARVRDLRVGGHAAISGGVAPDIMGFTADAEEVMTDRGGEAGERERGRGLLSRRVEVPLPRTQTYAVRMVTANENARATTLVMPEHTAYLGTQLRRCDIAGSAEYCCPAETRLEVDLASDDRTAVAGVFDTMSLEEPACISGSDSGNTIRLAGKAAHFVTLGGGADRVHVSRPGSVVLLGQGDDRLSTDRKGSSSVRAGAGRDVLSLSDLDDHVDAGEGDDVVHSNAGDDIVLLGEGDDRLKSGAGDDEIYPGSGRDWVDAGAGDDRVIYTHRCELERGGYLVGGEGEDRLVLATTAAEARRMGLRFSGFEHVTENASRASMFADCE